MRIQIAHQDEKIVILENETTDSKSRMSDQERCSSKNCLSFLNFPIIPLDKTLTMDMSNVIQKYFCYQVGPDRTKACRPLKRTVKNIALIIKFV